MRIRDFFSIGRIGALSTNESVLDIADAVGFDTMGYAAPFSGPVARGAIAARGIMEGFDESDATSGRYRG
jgi:hypothetical protein